MTEISETAPPLGLRTSTAARSRLDRRYAAERRFRFYGIAAIGLAVIFLILLLWSVIRSGLPAFIQYALTIEIELDEQEIAPDGRRDRQAIAKANFNAIIADAIRERFPHVSGRSGRRALAQLVSSGAPYLVRDEVLDDPELIGTAHRFRIPLSDTADLYLKGTLTGRSEIAVRGTATPVVIEGTVRISSTANDFVPVLEAITRELAGEASRRREEAAGRERLIARLQARISELEQERRSAGVEETGRIDEALARSRGELNAARGEFERLRTLADDLTGRSVSLDEALPLSAELPSFLIHINGGVVKALTASSSQIDGEVLHPLASSAAAESGAWTIVELTTPEGARKVSDREAVWIDQLVADGDVEASFNTAFFTTGASREAELAGIWGAVVGSFYTMVVTLILSFPLGVASAVYLEEFAGKNRWTWLIEVNINNLAAVPSIVFGLLGLAVFLGFFGLPRSAPLVGGMVLALMTLPTIIIAARAALRAVPPSIREAALAVGASRVQTVMHHVLPLAMPGILTGTIIGMAQALGETAPLLMIGMVAFIVDIPGGFTDPATVLPVQIYMWSDFPERAFLHKTAAAIMVLLGFLITMNALAVLLRKRFERRW